VNPDEFELTLDATPAPVQPGEVAEGETPTGLPTTHTVEKGETLWAIAERYYGSGYNITDLVSANNLKSPDDIEVGQELTIPEASAKKQTVTDVIVEETDDSTATPSIATSQAITGDTYTVQGSESLWDIALRAYGDGYQWTKIYEANKAKIGKNPNKLWKDLELTIPR
jgi:nucleoid-associated protein YgaU